MVECRRTPNSRQRDQRRAVRSSVEAGKMIDDQYALLWRNGTASAPAASQERATGETRTTSTTAVRSSAAADLSRPYGRRADHDALPGRACGEAQCAINDAWRDRRHPRCAQPGSCSGRTGSTPASHASRTERLRADGHQQPRSDRWLAQTGRMLQPSRGFLWENGKMRRSRYRLPAGRRSTTVARSSAPAESTPCVWQRGKLDSTR